MAMRLLHLCQSRALHAQKVHMHPDESLVHDMQARTRQQRMDIGDPAIGRILDRKHAEVDFAAGDLFHHFLESGAGNCLHTRAGLLAGLVRIGAKLSLKGDATGHLKRSHVENLPFGAIGRASTP